MPKSRIAARPATAVAVVCLTVGAGASALLPSPAFAGAAGSASAAKSIKVTVEAIGKPPAEKKLLEKTVTLSSAHVKKYGHSCSGYSAAGALQLATKGTWTGSWDAEYSDFEVTGIAGLTLPFESKSSANWYWALYLGGKEASAGVCEEKPKSGQTVLFKAACYGKSCPKSPKKAARQATLGEQTRRAG